MRKTRTKGGGQHPISARIDQDKWEWLQHKHNKNRIINEGLQLWKQNKDISDDIEKLLEEEKAGE